MPLEPADVQLYLSVMRAAAERVRHPTTFDVIALGATRAWNATLDAAAREHAKLPAPLDEAILERSANLTGHMTDLQIVGEHGIDLSRYQRIRNTIEAIIPLHPDALSCAPGASCKVDISSYPDEAKHRQTDETAARDRRLLRPHANEILALETTVRTGGLDDSNQSSGSGRAPRVPTTARGSSAAHASTAGTAHGHG